jgi:hypothetical protein
MVNHFLPSDIVDWRSSLINNVQAGGACRNIVRHVEKITAGSASNAKLNRSVVVEILFDNGIIVHDVPKTVAGNCREGNGDNSSG